MAHKNVKQSEDTLTIYDLPTGMTELNLWNRFSQAGRIRSFKLTVYRKRSKLRLCAVIVYHDNVALNFATDIANKLSNELENLIY